MMVINCLKVLKLKGVLLKKHLGTLLFTKPTNLGKLYLLPTIHKNLGSVPGRPVISNCDTSRENISEFLDSQLKQVMQNSRSYIKDSGDFIMKIKNISTIPKDSILVTGDVVSRFREQQ